MQTEDLHHLPELEDVPVLQEDDPIAVRIISPEQALRVAEATDVIRARELLCRDEYEVLAAVRFRRNHGEQVRVYFSRIHDSGAADERPLPQRPK